MTENFEESTRTTFTKAFSTSLLSCGTSVIVTFVFVNFSGIFSTCVRRGVSHQLTKFQLILLRRLRYFYTDKCSREAQYVAEIVWHRHRRKIRGGPSRQLNVPGASSKSVGGAA